MLLPCSQLLIPLLNLLLQILNKTLLFYSFLSDLRDLRCDRLRVLLNLQMLLRSVPKSLTLEIMLHFEVLELEFYLIALINLLMVLFL